MTNSVDVEKWLDKHSISNFFISKDLKVTVHGNVNLNGKLSGDKLPVTFDVVDGYFDISNNSLKSLEGSPEKVTGDFNCSHNMIESLIGSPIAVYDFNCSFNKLVNLSYCPKEIVGYLDCSNNELTTIKGSPRTVRGYFNCSENKIHSLKGGPKYVTLYFDCSHNILRELKGGPITVGEDYICHGNEIQDLDGISDEIGWDLITDVRLNHLVHSFDEQTTTWRYKGKDVVEHVYKPIVSLQNKEDIEKWLHKYDITNYKILEDNSVDVTGRVKLSDRLANLSRLPLKFNEITGDFDISDNELTSLEGCPSVVKGDFLAFKNEIYSLKGGPKDVQGNYIILKNNISNLKYAPTIVKDDFICSHNPIDSLEGLNLVQGSIFTNVSLPDIKSQKFVYNKITTYKYAGDLVCEYLDRIYVTLTDEEKLFETTRKKLHNGITKLLNNNSLKQDMVTDTLLKNLTKYNLNDLKEKVLCIKNPSDDDKKKELTEKELIKLAFDQEL
ncbi:MAG: hypothetical protein ACNI28_13000 [Arcobacter sp.]|uniref:hypothetical protein n=1 Tax=Arcobacter sp. TaxID=1872629 RepID=UPI003B0028A0